MANYDRYLDAADRPSTRRGYRSALKHYEETWGGLLPATEDALARYLAEHAEVLSLNTLKLRLAALARWHQEHGFTDPTKSPLVRRVLKGIGEQHPARERRAVPVAIETLAKLDATLSAEIERTRDGEHRAAHLRALRDRALLLLGFWRAFRTDELLRVCVEHVEAVAGEGMVIHLPRTKTVSAGAGIEVKVPALSRLCPVRAYLEWVDASSLREGPVLRRIGPNGALGSGPMHPNSLAPLLRKRLEAAGIPSPERYSGHSLRRGFATWASRCGWDLRELMDYVGWADVGSAMRYVDPAERSRRERIELALAQAPEASGVAPMRTPAKDGPQS